MGCCRFGSRAQHFFHTRPGISAVLVLPILWVIQSPASAELIEETSRSINAGGGVATNATYRSTNVHGQGNPLGFNTLANRLNHSGFLHADGRGPRDSDDSDGDEITDWDERAGSSFDPETPSSSSATDTDGDGHTDPVEVLAGTNPLDPLSRLRVLSIEDDSDQVVVTWLARAGKQYQVMGDSNVDGLVPDASPVATVTAGEGTGPWQETQPAVTNAPVDAERFYFIKLLP